MKTAEKSDKGEKSSADEPKADVFDDGIEYEDEAEHERDARLRSYSHPVYRCLFQFVTVCNVMRTNNYCYFILVNL